MVNQKIPMHSSRTCRSQYEPTSSTMSQSSIAAQRRSRRSPVKKRSKFWSKQPRSCATSLGRSRMPPERSMSRSN